MFDDHAMSEAPGASDAMRSRADSGDEH